MEATKERIDTLIKGIKEVAKLNRERLGFSGNFVPIVIVIGPDGEHAVQAIPFADREQKATMLKAITMTARQMNVIAIVVVNDTISVKIDKFSEHFNIPKDIGEREFEKIYSGIIDTQYDGVIHNLPPELLTDALCVIMKSPIFHQSVTMLPYHESVGDSISWDAETPLPEAEILMLDDWWDTDTPTVN